MRGPCRHNGKHISAYLDICATWSKMSKTGTPTEQPPLQVFQILGAPIPPWIWGRYAPSSANIPCLLLGYCCLSTPLRFCRCSLLFGLVPRSCQLVHQSVMGPSPYPFHLHLNLVHNKFWNSVTSLQVNLTDSPVFLLRCKTRVFHECLQYKKMFKQVKFPGNQSSVPHF